jgi:hypothetical protein
MAIPPDATSIRYSVSALILGHREANVQVIPLLLTLYGIRMLYCWHSCHAFSRFLPGRVVKYRQYTGME